jgi:hypothetical protein
MYGPFTVAARAQKVAITALRLHRTLNQDENSFLEALQEVIPWRASLMPLSIKIKTVSRLLQEIQCERKYTVPSQLKDTFFAAIMDKLDGCEEILTLIKESIDWYVERDEENVTWPAEDVLNRLKEAKPLLAARLQYWYYEVQIVEDVLKMVSCSA